MRFSVKDERCSIVIGKKFRLCYVKKKKTNQTFWVRVIFVFTNVNIQHGILLLIQSTETNVHDSDDGEMFKQAPNAYGT